MKKILFLVTLLLITACNEKIEENSKEKKNDSVINSVTKESPKLTQEDILHKLGLEMNGEKITIDMNQTNRFMKQMEIEMHGRAEEIEKKIEQADINFSKGFGFEMEGDKIAFDLNKTKDMLQQLNILMKDILLDVNRTVH